MAKTKTIKDLNPENVKKAIELSWWGTEWQQAVVDKLKAAWVEGVGDKTPTSSTTWPAPINTPDITPTNEPGLVDTTWKWAEWTTDSVVNPEGDITVDQTNWTEEIKTEETNVGQMQEDALAATQERADELEAKRQQELADAEARKNEKIKQEEEYRKKQEDLIKEKEKEVWDVQAEIDRKAEQAKQAEIDLLEKEKADALKLQQAKNELQEQKDAEAIRQAEIQVEVDRQRAAIAYNKLWLSFSSGIIQQSQAISDNAAIKIATLKTEANFNQTQAAADLNKIQFEYTRSINETIDKYTTIQLNNKKDIAERINATKTNLLLNNKEKQDRENELIDEYNELKTTTAKELAAEQERLADKAIAQAQAIENRYKAEQAEKKTATDTEITQWMLSRMTDIEIAAKEKELWLPAGTLKAQEKDQMLSSIRTAYDGLIWKDYAISNVDKIMSNTQSYMKQWKTMYEALTLAINEDLKTNPTYLSMQRAEKAKRDATISSAYSSDWWASGTWYTAAERDAFLAAWGKTSDLKNLEKTWGIQAATKALLKWDKVLQEAADNALKDLKWQTWAFENIDEAKIYLENAIDVLDKAWYTGQEILNRIWTEADIRVEVDKENQKINFYNKGLMWEDLILTK